MSDLLIEMTEPFLDPNSVIVVPDMYAIKAGIIGNMQGATNDPKPAIMATSIVTSVMNHGVCFSFKRLFQILSILKTFHFYLG